MATVVGLDMSLTSTGVSVIFRGEASVFRIESKGKENAPLIERANRLQDIAGQVLMTIEANDPQLVVIEQPAYSRTTGHMHDRSGLWWLVISALHSDSRPYVEVSPSTLKKYVLGKGGGRNVTKDAVFATVIRRYAEVNVTGNDEADALVLAAMAARHLGEPIEGSLPIAHLAAMDAVHWPPPPAGAIVPTGRNYAADTVPVQEGTL